MLDLGNVSRGVLVSGGATNNLIGGSAPGAGNVISGNDVHGIDIRGDGTTGNLVQGNLIGLNAAGTHALGNRLDGVLIVLGARNNRIGTYADGVGDDLERNVIAGNQRIGILFASPGTEDNVVAGNYVGLNAAGTAAVPNLQFGAVWIEDRASNNHVGTNADGQWDEAERNRHLPATPRTASFSGAPAPPATRWPATTSGPTRRAHPDWGSALNGVKFYGGASGNLVGGTTLAAGNTIAFNGGAGVLVQDAGSTGNRVRANSVFANGGLGIDLGGDSVTDNDLGDGVTPNDLGDADAGPNRLLNFPVLAAVLYGATTRVLGVLDSPGNGPFTLDVFANPAADPTGHGEGRRYLGSATLTADGAFDVTLSAATGLGEWVTATVTDAAGNSSEFSRAVWTNGLPVADAGGPYAVLTGGQLRLDASATADDRGPARDTGPPLGPRRRRRLSARAGRRPSAATSWAWTPIFTAAGLAGGITVTVRLRVTDSAGATDETAGTVDVQPVTTPNLQAALPQDPPAPTASPSARRRRRRPHALVAAVNGLAAPDHPVEIAIDLGGGEFFGITASPPPNVTLTFFNGTFNGGSPALVVASGTVYVLDSHAAERDRRPDDPGDRRPARSSRQHDPGEYRLHPGRRSRSPAACSTLAPPPTPAGNTPHRHRPRRR